MQSKSEKGLILIDVLIVILIAGIIAAIVVPQYTQKKVSRQNLIFLADAQDQYLKQYGEYAADIGGLSSADSVDPGIRSLTAPGGENYKFELPDSLFYIITCPLSHGNVRGKAKVDSTTTESKRYVSWDKQDILSQQIMAALADAQDKYFETYRMYAKNIDDLSSVDTGIISFGTLRDREYIFERDSLAYVITCPLGHGNVRGEAQVDSTTISLNRKYSWEK